MAENVKEKTLYVILRAELHATLGGSDTTLSYEEVGTVRASNDSAAVNTFLEAGDNGEKYGEGNYRAVPKRSWPDKPYEKKRRVVFQ